MPGRGCTGAATHPGTIDYVILGIYFIVVLGIGFVALMIFWALSRPVMPEPPETRGQGSGRLRRAPA